MMTNERKRAEEFAEHLLMMMDIPTVKDKGARRIRVLADGLLQFSKEESERIEALRMLGDELLAFIGFHRGNKLSEDIVQELQKIAFKLRGDK